nr:ribonuclease H-like domain-containing protein [Tanacetum cinerariifolium]
MDPNSSLEKICLGDDVVVISSYKVEGSGDWNSLEYQDTAGSKGKKVVNTLCFYRMKTYEISERYIVPCFVNGLEAYDSEVNLEFDENMISNEFAVTLCLDYEVKKGKRLVKLIVALNGELYFVKFIINPEKDDFEPGVILGRSFLRLANGVVDFSNGLQEHTTKKQDRHDTNAQDNTKQWKRYYFHKFTTSSCYRKDVFEMLSLDDMLRIRLHETGSGEKIFTSVAWIRAFNINEPIYAELCHEFYSTYKFDEVCPGDELQSKKIIRFRLGGRAHNLTLLDFARRLGLYQVTELEEEGFNVYFERGLRSEEHFNAHDYWLSISREEHLGLSRSHTSTIRNPILRVIHKMITYGLCQMTTGYDKIQKNNLWLLSMFNDRHQNGYANVAWFISKLARKCRVLIEDVIRSLSALIYCRDLDTITLRDLIDFDGKLIPDDPQLGVPRVGIPRPLRASMQDLYERMGRMEIRQEAIEHMEEPTTRLAMLNCSMTSTISSINLHHHSINSIRRTTSSVEMAQVGFVTAFKIRLLIEAAGTKCCCCPQVVSAAKLPILNNLWKMRIEQYFLMTDYSLWERFARNNKIKARGTLLIALPDKNQLKFNIHKNAKTLMEAIEKRFRENKEIKKKLIGQLEILKESLSQEDINLKFFRSLPTEWRTHTLIWKNKTDLKEQSLDDLFKNLKIYEAEVKSSSFASTSTQNIVFVSSSNTDSTNEPFGTAASVSVVSAKIPVSALPNVDTLSNAVIYSFFASQSTSPQLDNDNLKQIDADDLEEMDLKWQMAMLTVRARRFLQRTERNLRANGPTSIGFDMSKVECYNFHRKGHFARESMTGVFRQKRNLPTMLLWPSHLQVLLLTMSPAKPDTNLSHTQRPSAPIIKDWVSNSEDDSEAEIPQNAPSFVQPIEQVKTPRSSVKTIETSIPTANPKTAIPKPKSNGNRKNRKECFVCKSLDHLIKDCDFYEKKMAQTPARNHSKLVPITVARPVTAAVLKPHVTRPRQAKSVVTKPHSPHRRHINGSLSPKASNFPPKVTTVKVLHVNDAKSVQGKWEWKPKCPILDHVSRNTSASITLNRFDYNDALGRSKSVMA